MQNLKETFQWVLKILVEFGITVIEPSIFRNAKSNSEEAVII